MSENADDPRHNLRLTPELKRKLKHAVADSGRSMNAEILARLEKSFDPDPGSLIVKALEPIAHLSEQDRIEAGQFIAALGAILAKAPVKK